MSAVPLAEDLHKYRRQYSGAHIVSLAFDDTTLGARNRLAQFVCRGTHERHGLEARATVHHQRGRFYPGGDFDGSP